MSTRFEYLLQKVRVAECTEEPFKHIEILDFLSDSHFKKIIESPEIRLKPCTDSRELCDELLNTGYNPIKFPGCTTSIDDYLTWKNGKGGYENVDTCEGFGIAFRLQRAESEIIREMMNFLSSDAFFQTLAARFDIKVDEVFQDTGIQKYLDGYEISPHPDIRRKALTFMVNINPYKESENLNIHTHYLQFKPEKKYVQEFWRYNKQYDRAWVPWNWCETVKQQTRNNSIVIFSPAHDTMHAVRAEYDHLITQRTQLYGNLWFGKRDSDDVRDKSIVNLPQIPWQGLQIDERHGSGQKRINTVVMSPARRVVKKLFGRG